MTDRIAIGIDPGVNTGVAVWDLQAKAFRSVASMRIHQAMRLVAAEHGSGALQLVVFEDARQRNWFGCKGREALQGAGSIKRDCGIWHDYLRELGIKAQAQPPARGQTKWNVETFAKLTGWQGRCNEHARDAALLVWNWGA